MGHSKRTLKKKARITFEIFDTEEEAMEFCKQRNEKPVSQKCYTAHYTPWCDMSGTECGFVAWYAV